MARRKPLVTASGDSPGSGRPSGGSGASCGRLDSGMSSNRTSLSGGSPEEHAPRLIAATTATAAASAHGRRARRTDPPPASCAPPATWAARSAMDGHLGPGRLGLGRLVRLGVVAALHGRQPDGEDRPLVDLADHVDVAAVQVDVLQRDGKAEPGAALRPGAVHVGAVEALEDVLQILLGD